MESSLTASCLGRMLQGGTGHAPVLCKRCLRTAQPTFSAERDASAEAEQEE